MTKIYFVSNPDHICNMQPFDESRECNNDLYDLLKNSKTPKKDWNEWVKNNPQANICFEELDLSFLIEDVLCDDDEVVAQKIDFRGFKFPEGNITFDNVTCQNDNDYCLYIYFDDITFKKGNILFRDFLPEHPISFKRTNFGDGNFAFHSHIHPCSDRLSFDSAIFGLGKVSFHETEFLSGVIFDNAEFYSNKVDLIKTHFYNRNVSFKNTKFYFAKPEFINAKFGIDTTSRGTVSFDDAYFYCGVNFNDTKFNGSGRVSFLRTQFGKSNADEHKISVNFERMKFGDGIKNFQQMNFINADIRFNDTNFGKGETSFNKSEFSGIIALFSGTYFHGRVSFSKVKFQTETLEFEDVTFEQGNINFYLTEFPNQDVSFKDSTFGQLNDRETKILFIDTKFGEGTKDFSNVTFNGKETCFANTNFNKGNVNFKDASFNTIFTRFTKTKFDNGNLDFKRVSFNSKLVDFNNLSFGNGWISFSGCYFSKGLLNFTPKNLSQCTGVGFIESIMECAINLTGIQSPCAINFSKSKIDGRIEFDGTNIGYAPDPTNPHTSTAFRCLKKFAKDNEDREREIDFFAKEIRANYNHGLKNRIIIQWAYKTYDWISDFGRSFTTPFLGLITSIIFFSLIYKMLLMDRMDIYFYILSLVTIIIITMTFIKTRIKYITVLLYLTLSVIGLGSYLEVPSAFSKNTFALSATYSLPFYSASVTGRKALEEIIFCKKNPEKVRSKITIIGIFQGTLSSIFLFLMALALRNRFRSS